MTVWSLAAREARHRKWSFLLGLVGVAVAVGTVVGALTSLRTHAQQTERLLAGKTAKTEARLAALAKEMRLATLKLSFNMVILPEGQNLRDWYADDYGAKYMPESYVTKLSESGIVTVRHFLSALQQKIVWPEQHRTIILVGSRGEVPNLHKNPVKPLVQAVPAGSIVLGYELHRTLGMKVGDEVVLMGRRFTVHRCHEERGSKDDITAWIPLQDAQELLDKKGLVNAILALECLCAGPDALPTIRAEITRILPGTQVIERGTKALARAEARSRVGTEAKAALAAEKRDRAAIQAQREAASATLLMVILPACAAWIGLLAWANVRARKPEIGMLRAMGWRTHQVLLLFLLRCLFLGIAGGAFGYLCGRWAGRPEAGFMDWPLFGTSLAVATVLAVLAGWLPALMGAMEDPAAVLQEH